jgi:hypothetical protein
MYGEMLGDTVGRRPRWGGDQFPAGGTRHTDGGRSLQVLTVRGPYLGRDQSDDDGGLGRVLEPFKIDPVDGRVSDWAMVPGRRALRGRAS